MTRFEELQAEHNGRRKAISDAMALAKRIRSTEDVDVDTLEALPQALVVLAAEVTRLEDQMFNYLEGH